MLHLLGELSLFMPVVTLFSILLITQFSDQVKFKDTLQLINGIFKVLQKLLKYFNGTAISTFFVPILFASYSGLSTSLPYALVTFTATL